MKLLVIIEATPTGYSAYAPDLDGCVATGRTRAEVEEAMHGAITMHVEALRADGVDLPPPHSDATWFEIAA